MSRLVQKSPKWKLSKNLQDGKPCETPKKEEKRQPDVEKSDKPLKIGEKIQLGGKISAILRNKTIYLALLIIVVTIVYIARLYDLQIIHGSEYLASANKTAQTGSDILVPSKRGDIVDTNGEVLATTRQSYEIRIVNTSDSQAVRDDMYLRLVTLFEENNDVYANPLGKYVTSEFEWGKSIDGEDEQVARGNWLTTIVSGHKKSDKDSLLTALDAFYYLRNTVFDIDDGYTDEEAYKIMVIRYQTYLYGLSSTDPLTIATDASASTADFITTHYYEFPGVLSEIVYFRSYPEGTETVSNVIGYVRAISSEEYEQYKDLGYTNSDLIGKLGIEKSAETYLRGQYGTAHYFKNNDGALVSETTTEAVMGATVKLTIDLKFQTKCVDILRETIEYIAANKNDVTNFGDANAGSAVVMNVKTGAVYALANYPYYDNSIFVAPSTDQEAQQAIIDLLNDPDSPSLNRATQGLYPVGSTVKPAVSISALMSGTITKNTIVDCEHTITIANHTHSCLGTHGKIALVEAIQRSCNIYFYTVGIETGIETIDTWFKNFGLGEKTGIEIAEYQGERSNPTTMAKRETDKTHVWSDSDTAQTSIGQLYTLFTPLQLCRYTAALANGGYLVTPHVIDSIVDANGNVLMDSSEKESERVETGASPEALATVKEGMLAMAANSGLARQAFSAFPEGFVAAKTGTPETGLEAFGQSSHSVLICYAPADDPEIAIAIVIEHGVAGGNSLAAAGKILNAYYGIE